MVHREGDVARDYCREGMPWEEQRVPRVPRKGQVPKNARCGGERNGERAWPSSVGKIRELKVEKERRVTQKEEVGKVAR